MAIQYIAISDICTYVISVLVAYPHPQYRPISACANNRYWNVGNIG